MQDASRRIIADVASAAVITAHAILEELWSDAIAKVTDFNFCWII